MKKKFTAGDEVLVHDKWSGLIVSPARKNNQWVVTFLKKGVLLTNTVAATQIEHIDPAKSNPLQEAA